MTLNSAARDSGLVDTGVVKMEKLDHEQISFELYGMLPKDQIERVMTGEVLYDIAPDFLGFVSTYKMLSKLIPEHFTVVDLGCGYNAQSFFFLNHKKYIAVDYGTDNIFMSPNCTFFNMPIDEYVEEFADKLDIAETFAICNYVPSGWSKAISKFKNIYTYYPHGSLKLKI